MRAYKKIKAERRHRINRKIEQTKLHKIDEIRLMSPNTSEDASDITIRTMNIENQPQDMTAKNLKILLNTRVC